MIATNNIQYLGVTLTSVVKDLFDINFKDLKKEIEVDTRKWNGLLCSQIGRINTAEISLEKKDQVVVAHTFNSTCESETEIRGYKYDNIEKNITESTF